MLQEIKSIICSIILKRKLTQYPLLKASEKGSHIFSGYYDVSPVSYNDEILLALKSDGKNMPPERTSEAAIGYYNLMEGDLIYNEIDRTTAWCWQQGARLQWYPEKSNETVIYNKVVKGKYSSIIKNIKNNKVIKTLLAPVYSLSHNGKYGLSLNFSRLHRLRPGYGYAPLPDETKGVKKPENDGIWHIDMNNGRYELIISLADIVKIDPLESMDDAEHYFNHVLFNPDDSRFMFLHLWNKNKKRYSRLITASDKGQDICILNNEGHVSHYIWKSINELLVYSMHKETGTHYHLYNDNTNEKKVIGNGVLNWDGHPSYSKDGRYILIDTYPDRKMRQKLLLYDTLRNKIIKIGSFFCPYEYRGEVRCDLHPKFSLSNRYICFDSVLDGKRSVYLLNGDDVLE